MPKYLSGRVKRRDQAYLSTDRYQFLGLDQAEPNLGDSPGLNGSLDIPAGQQYQIVSLIERPGERFWVPIGGGVIPGSISIFDEGSIVGTLNSITQLNFTGNAITASGADLRETTLTLKNSESFSFTKSLTVTQASSSASGVVKFATTNSGIVTLTNVSGTFDNTGVLKQDNVAIGQTPNGSGTVVEITGVGVTIRVAPTGNENEVLFVGSDDFSTDTRFSFVDGLLNTGDRIAVGVGGTVITTTDTGKVGIGSTIPIAKLDMNVGSAFTAVNVTGTEGQLLLITDDITSGSIFAVNDVSGMPSIDVDATGTIQLAPFGENEFVGIGTTNPISKLHVVGHTELDNLRVSGVSTFQDNIFVGTGATVGFGTTAYFRDDASAVFGDDEGFRITRTDTLKSQVDSNGDQITLDQYVSIIEDKGDGPLIFKSNGGGGPGAFQFFDVDWRPILKLKSGANGNVSLYQGGERRLSTTEEGILVSGGTTTGDFKATGISTFAGITTVTGETLFTKQLNVSGISTFVGLSTFSKDIFIEATTDTNQLNVSGVSTFVGLSTFIGDVFIEATTDTNQLNVSGVSTFVGNAQFNDKVGINSTAPETKLDVIMSSANRTWTPGSSVVSMFERSGNNRITIVSGNDSVGRIEFGDANDDNAGYIQYHHRDDSMSFRADKGERLRITSGGDVGIGTTIPTGTNALTNNNARLAVGIVTTNSLFSRDLMVTGVSTFMVNVETQQLKVSGVSTFQDDISVGVGATVGFGTTAYFRDNAKAVFGDGEDLKIYHSGEHSYIQDTGTGNLFIDNSYLTLRDGSGTKIVASFTNGTGVAGGVQLYFGNSKKFQTRKEGILVSGGTTTGDFKATGVSTFTGNIVPATTNSVNIGESVNLQFNKIFANEFIGQINTVQENQEVGNLQVNGISTFIGVSTFADGIHVLSGIATFDGNIDANANLDVDGTTTLDNTTIDGLLDINAGGQANTFKVEDLTEDRVVIVGTDGKLDDSANLTFNGSTLTVTGTIDANGDLDVDGHTELDDLNVSGFSTFVNNAEFKGNVSIAGTLTYEDVTNVDSIGLITARNGIHVTGAGVSVAGISTFIDNVEFRSNVGIGTDSPDQKLHVYNGAGNVTSFVEAIEGDAILDISNSGNGNFSGINFTRERKTVGGVRQTGRIGGSIFMPSNTASNEAFLYIQTQSANADAGDTDPLDPNNGVRLKLHGDDGIFSIETGDSERLRIDNDGNVGIGSIIPIAKLDVFGQTELDDLNVSGVSTFKDDVEFHGASGIASITFDKSANELNFKDDVKLTFGDDGTTDSQIHFDGANLNIKETSPGGSLRLDGHNIFLRNPTQSDEIYLKCNGQSTDRSVELYHQGEQRLETTKEGILVSGGTTTGDFRATGVSTFQDDIFVGVGATVGFGTTAYFRDNARAVFGNDEDLKIYHAGDHSYIDEFGTGNLRIRSNNFVLVNADRFAVNNGVNNQNIINSTVDGGIILYQGANEKVKTTNEGILVSGGTTTGTLSVTGISTHVGFSTFKDGIFVAGVSTFAGNIDAKGNTTLGDNASSDTLTVNATSTFTNNVSITRGTTSSGLTRTLSIGGARNQGNHFAAIDLKNYDSDSSPVVDYVAARITGTVPSTPTNGGELVFYTSPTGGNPDGITVQERLRINAGGNVGINSSVPIAKLDVFKAYNGLGVGNAAARIYGTDSGVAETGIRFVEKGSNLHTSSTSYLMRGISNGTTQFVFGANGNVGIGTSLPDAPLHIVSAADALGILSSTDSGANFDLYDDTTQSRIRTVDGRLHIEADKKDAEDDSEIRFFVDGTRQANISSEGHIYFSSDTDSYFHRPAANNLAFVTNDEERFRIKSDGNIGIGTDNPNAKLHIGPVDGDTTPHLYLASQNNLYGFRIDTDDLLGGNVPLRIFARSNGNDTERIRVKQTGEVGIGTDTPDHHLHVVQKSTDAYGTGVARFEYYDTDDDGGDQHYDARFIPTGTYIKTFITGAGTDFLIVDADNIAGRHSFAVEGNAGDNKSFTVDSTGLVGIGTDNPGAKLDVRGSLGISAVTDTSVRTTITSGSSGLFVNHGDNSPTIFQNRGIERFRITKDGEVGIGTNDPKSELHVENAIGTATTVIISQQKTYGVGSGTAERARLDLAIRETNTTADNRIFGRIETGPESETTSEFSFLAFSTRKSGSISERLRINSDGVLEIERGSAKDQAIDIKTTATTGASRIRFVESGVSKGELAYSHNNNQLELVARSGQSIVMFTNGVTEKVRINLDGDLLRGGTEQDIGSASEPWDKVYANEFIGLINTTQENVTTGNLLVTGIATFQGNVSIAGTLTYEDVTNIDSLGIVTARTDVHVGAGLSVVGISTFNSNLNVDDINIGQWAGHANYAGVFHKTQTGNEYMLLSQGDHTFLSANSGYDVVIRGGNNTNTNNIRVTPDSDGIQISGNTTFYNDIDVDGTANLDDVDIDGDLDVDGHTELDDLNVSGFSTFVNDVEFKANVSIAGTLTCEDVTNVDSIGIITARRDVHVGAGVSAVGIGSFGSLVVAGATTLENASTLSDSLKITTSTGYVEVGSQNTSNAHFYTDRQRFYFNKRIIVDEGIIGSFNEDLVFVTDKTEERIRIKNDTGDVGINSTTPAARLDVFKAYNGLGVGNTAARIYGTDSGVEETGVHFVEKGTNLHTSSTAYLIRGISDGATKFVFGANGNVGIGSTIPSAKLDVAGDINVLSKIGWGEFPNASFLDFDDDNSAVPFPTGTNNLTLASISGMNLIYDTNNNDNNGFMIAHGNPNAGLSTPVLVIDENDRVGIGTDNPNHLLHVVQKTTDAYGTGVARFEYYDTDDDGGDQHYDARFIPTGTYFKTFITGAGTDFLIVDADNVAGRASFAVESAGGTERFRVDSTGNVGINSSVPTSKLDVDGDTKLQGNLNVTGVSTFVDDIFVGTGATVGFGTTAYFRDNAKAVFGNDEDLKIYHDGEDSIIEDSGTGSLELRTSTLKIKNSTETKLFATANVNGVKLYENNNIKFETTNEGILVSGGTTTGDLRVTGVSTFQDDIFIGVGATVGFGTTAYFNDNAIIDGSLTVGAPSIITGGAPTDQGNLAVYGTGKNSLIIQTTSNEDDRGIAFRNAGDAYVAYIAAIDRGDSEADLRFGISNRKDSIDDVSERMRITKEGNVGIGTTNPIASNINTALQSNTTTLAVGVVTAKEYFGTFKGTIDTDAAITNANNVNITDDTSASGTHYIHFGSATSGYDGVEVDSTGLVYKNGLFGISQINPSAPLHVVNSVTLGNTAGIGTQTILKLQGAVGNAGILEFKNKRIANGSTWETSTFRIQRVIDVTEFGYIDFGTGSSASGHDIQFGKSTTTSNDMVYMHLDNTGNVGIGTDDPASKLEVRNESGTNPLLTLSHSIHDVEGEVIRIGRTNATIRYHSIKAMHGGAVTNNYIAFHLHDGTSPFTNQTEVLRLIGSGDVGIGTNNPIGTNALTNNNSTLAVGIITANSGKITNNLIVSGNIGIGTDDPDAPLHVVDNSNLLGILSSTTGGANLDLYDDDTQSRIRTVDGRLHLEADKLNQHDDSQIRFTIDNSIKATISAGASFSFNNDTDTYFHRPAANNLAFVTNDEERLRIKSNGNVGIGTDDPDQKLHVHKGSSGTVTSDNNAVITLENNNHSVLQILSPTDKSGRIMFGDPDDTNAGQISYDHNIDALSVQVNGGEKARILSGGEVFVGCTTSVITTPKFAVNVGPNNLHGVTIHSDGAENDGDLSGLAFSHGNNSTDLPRPKAAIALRATGSFGRGHLCFYVDGTNDNNPVSSADEKLRITSDGKVGVGVDPQYNLHVVGTAAATNFDSLSDRKVKTNIKIIQDPIDKIKKIDGVSFNWKSDNKPSLGVIADNVEEVLPEIVSGNDPKSVNYNGLIGLLIEVVKDQQKQIDELRGLLDK